MTIPDKYRVWVVESNADGFDLIKRSVAGADWLMLQHFDTADAFLGEVSNAVMNPSMLPHVVFCDFFLGEDTGSDVLEKFNELFIGMDDYKPYFVTFSSIPKANQSMVEQGAPWEILKEKEAQESVAIKEFFASKEKLAQHLGHGS
jgi:hypothetical protein